MLITKEIEVDVAHRLPNHASKCRNLHGHRYRIEVGIDDKIINNSDSSSDGMVIDFADVKKVMMEHIDTIYDHNSIFQDSDPLLPELLNMLKKFQEKEPIVVEFAPTVENICRHFYMTLQPIFKNLNIELSHVKVWETPTCSAIYTKRDS